jgi:hypothetical protein
VYWWAAKGQQARRKKHDFRGNNILMSPPLSLYMVCRMTLSAEVGEGEQNRTKKHENNR